MIQEKNQNQNIMHKRLCEFISFQINFFSPPVYSEVEQCTEKKVKYVQIIKILSNDSAWNGISDNDTFGQLLLHNIKFMCTLAVKYEYHHSVLQL